METKSSFYKIFRDLVYVRKIEEKKIDSGIVLPDNQGKHFIKLAVLQVGPGVKEDIKIGDIVLAENMFESTSIDKTEGLILSQYIMGAM